MDRALWFASLALVAPCTGCRHAAAPARDPEVVEVVRRAVATCPVPLTDAALDDLATYERCVLPPEIARLVRNDYGDDELRTPDLSLLRRHAGQVSRATFEAQLHRFIDPSGTLQGVVEVDVEHDLLRPDPVLAPDVAVPFAPAAETFVPCAPAAASCEGRLVPPPGRARPYRAQRRAELLANASTQRPLAGVRVGLDPGHAGGRYAGLEDRHLVAGADPQRLLVLQEGDLTLRTALELEAKLAALGADVVLTRHSPGLVHGLALHELRPAAELLLRRIALDPAYTDVEGALAPADRLRLRSALALFAVRKQSRFESLRARARVLSEAHPDLVLSIHYNATPRRAGAGGEEDLVAMIGGFYDASRLYNPYHRWRALEAAFAVDDFDASAHLGALCVREMAARMGIAAARRNHYPDHLAIRGATGEPVGVDAWDGALLRYLDGVAVLTEGPYMDQRDETQRLVDALAAPSGTPGTRIEQYADALSSCVEQFVARWLGSQRNPFSADP